MPKLRSALILAAFAAAVLLALFLWLRPPPPPQAAPAAQTFEFIVQGGRLAAGPAAMRAREGQTLRVRIVSDQRDHWHLHGYDLELQLSAGQPAEVSFVATRSGRFEHELHHSHLTLGVLEVLPR